MDTRREFAGRRCSGYTGCSAWVSLPGLSFSGCGEPGRHTSRRGTTHDAVVRVWCSQAPRVAIRFAACRHEHSVSDVAGVQVIDHSADVDLREALRLGSYFGPTGRSDRHDHGSCERVGDVVVFTLRVRDLLSALSLLQADQLIERTFLGRAGVRVQELHLLAGYGGGEVPVQDGRSAL